MAQQNWDILIYQQQVRIKSTWKYAYRNDCSCSISEEYRRNGNKLRFYEFRWWSREDIYLADDEYWIVEEWEKTYVISYTTELIDNEWFIYGSLPHTEYIQAASIDSALERLKQDKDTINITYIYHD